MNEVKHARWSTVALLVVAAGFCARGSAETLEVTSPLVQGYLVTDTSFYAPGPGTVTAILSDLGWPDSLSSLTLSAVTPNKTLGSWQGPGEFSFAVSGPGVYSVVVGAVSSPSSFLDLGWYCMKIDFTPATVALPGTAWLLLGGLGMLFSMRRQVSGTVQRPGVLSRITAALRRPAAGADTA